MAESEVVEEGDHVVIGIEKTRYRSTQLRHWIVKRVFDRPSSALLPRDITFERLAHLQSGMTGRWRYDVPVDSMRIIRKGSK